MKPVKECTENPDYPAASVFQGIKWELSGGTKQAGIIAASLVLGSNIDTVIEIGIYYGFTSHILAKSLASNTENGFLFSVDINPRAIQRSKNITKGLPITHLHLESDSKLVNYKEVLNGRKVGLAFVDGNHTHEYAGHDIRACYEVLKPYGYIVVHDYSKTGFPGVYQAVSEFIKETGDPLFYIEENRESTDYRTAIIQKKGNY